jgi:RNA polymerase sigma factor (sigma-70 family)
MPALNRLRQTLLRLAPPTGTDADLLARFATDREEAAFAALVARHGPMVLATCRRVLGHHDAEDACQAAFLVLARRAAGLRINGSVAAWLHGVARRAATAARRTAERRRAHEARAVPGRPDGGPDDDTAELRAVLDDEIASLPAKYRAVLVLADLEGRDRRDVAAELGLPVGTVASRHARARARLAARLRQRGWEPAAVLAAVTPLGVSDALARRTVALAAGGRAATEALTRPELLAREVMTTMTKTKLALTAVGLGVVLVAVGLAGDGPTPAHKGAYSVYTDNGSTILVDSTTGRSWVLQQSPGKDPAWVPVKGPEQPPPARPAAEPPTKPARPAAEPPAKPAPPAPVGALATGRLALAQASRVHPRAAGVVTKVHIRAGDTVVAGQLLVEMDDTDAKLAVDAAMANLAVAEVSLPPRERALPAQETRLAEAEVKKAQVEVSRAKAALQATRLTAPIAGTVVELNVGAGDSVVPVSPTVVVADLRALVAVADVAEADADRVAVGQPCAVQVGAGGKVCVGLVAEVGTALDPANGTIPVRVRVRIPDGQKAPPAGSFVSVRFLDKK